MTLTGATDATRSAGGGCHGGVPLNDDDLYCHHRPSFIDTPHIPQVLRYGLNLVQGSWIKFPDGTMEIRMTVNARYNAPSGLTTGTATRVFAP